MIRIETDERSGFVALVFPKWYTITKPLFARLQDAKFEKIAALGNHYVASPHLSEKQLCIALAHIIRKECEEGKYKKEMLYPRKTRIKHG